jgi:hypothetical protein
LIFGSYYNRRITNDVVNWPKLSKLYFRDYFNQDIISDKFKLPPSITTLRLSNLFDKDIITIGYKLPILTELLFQDEFNQPIKHVHFPNTLTILKFGFRFNQNVDVELNALQILHFGEEFNQFINICWPELTEILFEKEFNQKLNSLICPKLTVIMLYTEATLSIEQLNLTMLLSLQFNNNFNEIIDQFNLSSLQTLKFGMLFNQPIAAHWPELTKLLFGRNFNQTLNTVICPKLTELLFGQDFNQNLDALKCPNLTTLTLGQKFAKAKTILFDQLHIINDYSNTVTESSYKIPKTLHEIAHYIDNIRTVIYKRHVGQHTKSAIFS